MPAKDPYLKVSEFRKLVPLVAKHDALKALIGAPAAAVIHGKNIDLSFLAKDLKTEFDDVAMRLRNAGLDLEG